MLLSRRKLMLAGTTAALVAGGYLGYTSVFASKAPAPTAQPAEVAKGNLVLTVTSTGTVKPIQVSDLSFRSSGLVEQVYVLTGDTVKKGQPLAKLETRTLELAAKQSEIDLGTARISLETLITGARPEDISSANAAVASSKQRLTTMEAQGTPQDIATAQANYLTAKARLDQLTNPTETDILAAQNAVTKADADRQAAQAKLDDLLKPTSAAITAAQAVVVTAKASVLSAQLKLDNLKNPPPDQLNSAQSAVTSAENALASANNTLQQLQIGLTDVNRKNLVDAYRKMFIAQDKLNYDKATNASSDVITQDQAVLLQAIAVVNAAEELTKFPQAGATAQQIRNADTAIVIAQTNLDSARYKLDQLIHPTSQDIAAAESAVLTAQSNVLTNQAKLDQLLNPTLSDIATAKAAVTSSDATFQKAKDALEQLRHPRAADLAAAQASLVQAQTQLDKAQLPYTEADLASQRASVEQGLANLSKITSPGTSQDIARAQLSVEKAQLNLDQARYNLDQAVIIAPFDGMISNVAVTAGAAQGVGSSTIVMSIIDPTTMQVQANVDETDVAKLALGQNALITVDAVGQRPFQGQITAIAPNATVQSGVTNYQITMSIRQPTGLRSGMTATAQVVYQQRQDVLLIPSRAIRTAGRERTVQLLVDGKPETRTIEVGLSDDQRTEVTSGLQLGDQVLIEGARAPTAAQQRLPQGAVSGAGGLGGAGFTGGAARPPAGR